MVELLEQTNCYVNKIELMSLHPVLLFYQLRYELAPVQIYGDLVGSRLPTFISPTHPPSLSSGFRVGCQL